MKKKSLLEKVLSTGLVVATALTLNCCTPQVQVVEENQIREGFAIIREAKTSKKYGMNVKYYNFSQLPLESLPEKEIGVPLDMEWHINYNKPRINDQKNFERIVLEEAAKLGHSEEELNCLSLEKAVKMAMDITASRMTPHLVDNDKEFSKKYGVDISHDEYFEIGLGDCDKYANIAIGIFDILKEKNPNLKNAYLSNSSLGGRSQLHEWNSLIILKEDSILLSHLDPMWYDSDNVLEAFKYHINLKGNIYLAKFYYSLSDYSFAFDIYKNAYEKVEKEDKEEISGNMAFSAYMLKSVEKIRWLEEQYYENDLTEGLDKILCYYYKILKEVGFVEEAEEKKKELLEKFPDSVWAK